MGIQRLLARESQTSAVLLSMFDSDVQNCLFYHNLFAKGCCLSVIATTNIYNISVHHIVNLDNFASRNLCFTDLITNST